PTKGDYLLTYAVNSGYAAEIKTWQAHHPEVLVHCFWDGDQESAQVEIQKNLFLHRIDQQKFTQLLVHCKAYACTAGFESVCEAMYLSKPIFLVPVSQHIEQANNAVDAAKTGYCHIGTHFNLDAFMKFINQEFDNSTFKKWILSAPQRYLDDLNR
ncbi:MAG TPA: glycosyltransferase family protein, partial [Cytophagales bacterium]|nr:glycosyltransferase family protein [Cytophagales bacterium]